MVVYPEFKAIADRSADFLLFQRKDEDQYVYTNVRTSNRANVYCQLFPWRFKFHLYIQWNPYYTYTFWNLLSKCEHFFCQCIIYSVLFSNWSLNTYNTEQKNDFEKVKSGGKLVLNTCNNNEQIQEELIILTFWTTFNEIFFLVFP